MKRRIGVNIAIFYQFDIERMFIERSAFEAKNTEVGGTPKEMGI